MISGCGRFRFPSRITTAVTAALTHRRNGADFPARRRGTALAARQQQMRFVRDPWALRAAVLSACVVAGVGVSSGAGVQDGDEPRRIDVVARRFSFEPAEIEVRSGERVELHVRSADGVHGLEIRQLEIKRRIPRGGSIARIAFIAPAPGQYPILCSEYCGADHEDMKGLLVVRATDGRTPE